MDEQLYPDSAPPTGTKMSGTKQFISAEIDPYDWAEEGIQLDWVRVTVANSGWLDDSISGDRFVIWLAPCEGNFLEIRKILWAQHCSRPNHSFYSAEPCP